jgi:hypothetical protein
MIPLTITALSVATSAEVFSADFPVTCRLVCYNQGIDGADTHHDVANASCEHRGIYGVV